MGSLLIEDRPLMILPKLAEAIGLNEAIFTQQLHYWLINSSSKRINGRKWIYNTYQDWQDNFPFWSKNTIVRTINSCVNQGVVITDNFNKMKMDKTKWYSIDYEKINRMSRPFTQNGYSMNSNWVEPSTQNGQSNTIDYTETTTETTDILSSSDEHDVVPYQSVVDYLNEKTHSNFKASTKKTRQLIHARSEEGFALDDFKKVIDNKVSQWLNDPKMNVYLRPATLFGTKFEGYLNEKQPTKSTGANGQRYTDEDIDHIFEEAGFE